LACRLAIVPPRSDAAITRSVTRLLGVSVGLMTLAALGILLSRTLELDGGDWSTVFADMRVAVTATHFGHIWRWRIPALVLLWLAWGWSRRHPQQTWATWLMAVALAAIALTRSNTGHPADHGDFLIAVWIDWLHVLAAGTWVGSLFGMTLAVFPHLLRQGARALEDTAAVFQRLSTLSGIALAVLMACGIYNVIQQLGPVSALWNSCYGITLDIKLALVLTMIAIGAHNRYLKLPRLRACAGLPATRPLLSGWLHGHDAARASAGEVMRSCARAILFEGLLGLAVIGATGVLLHQMPPADAPPAHTMWSPAQSPDHRARLGFDCGMYCRLPAGVNQYASSQENAEPTIPSCLQSARRRGYRLASKLGQRFTSTLAQERTLALNA
jgi:putative copper export protein